MEIGEGLQVQVVRDTAQAPSLWAIQVSIQGETPATKIRKPEMYMYIYLSQDFESLRTQLDP